MEARWLGNMMTSSGRRFIASRTFFGWLVGVGPDWSWAWPCIGWLCANNSSGPLGLIKYSGGYLLDHVQVGRHA
jgi:hypothetical protein